MYIQWTINHIKRKEILIIWMHFENILLNERRNKKLLIVCFLSEIARRGKSKATGGRFMVIRERGEEGNGVWLLNGYEVFGSDKVLKLKRDGNCTHCEYPKCHWIAHFKMVNCMLCEFHFNLKKKKSSTVAYIMPLNQP